jgi:hypothetical protein
MNQQQLETALAGFFVTHSGLTEISESEKSKLNEAASLYAKQEIEYREHINKCKDMLAYFYNNNGDLKILRKYSKEKEDIYLGVAMIEMPPKFPITLSNGTVLEANKFTDIFIEQ